MVKLSMFRTIPLAMGLFCGAIALPPQSVQAAVIADSVQDFSDQQGQDGWYYGYYEIPKNQTAFSSIPTSTFQEMKYFDSGQFWEETIDQPNETQYDPSTQYTWTMLNNVMGHPATFPDTENHWAVRRWVSDFAGDVTISGRFGDINSQSNDGTIGYIFLDGAKIYEQATNNFTVFNYSLQQTLAVGSVLDFAINPEGNDLSDSTQFTAQIQTVPPTSVPTPALLPGLIGFGVSVLKKRRERFGQASQA